MSTKHPRRCQPSFKILSELELDLLAVTARAADVERVLFVEHEGKRIARTAVDPSGFMRALFPGRPTLANVGVVADLVSAIRRLLGSRELLSCSQREIIFREPWYASAGDFPPDHWTERTRALRQTIFAGTYRLSAARFLTKRATEILEMVNDLVAMHYAPAPPCGPVKASRRQRALAQELAHDAA